MKYSLFESSDSKEIIALYTRVFTDSEGVEEGENIGNLVTNLIDNTAPSDLIGYVATDDSTLIGCILFSRFIVQSGQVAYLLSPVAIETALQRTGIGQRLIAHGLDYLKSIQVNLVFTYGNPYFYSKTGFQQISESVVKAPFPLSQPYGWLAQSLDGGTIEAMSGTSQCVTAFQNPSYW